MLQTLGISPAAFGPLFGVIGTLGNALMVAFLIAAAIPFLIHLWSRRRFVERRFAAMEYLRRAMQRHARRIAIEHWILLALRTLIVLLLVFALTDPRVRDADSDHNSRVTRGARHWVLVIDRSYSMDYRQANTSRLEVARQLASGVVEQSPDGDAFSLVAMGAPAEIVVNDPAFDRDEAIRQIETIRLQDSTADLGQTLGCIQQVLETSKRKRSRFDTVRVVFLTDLGATTWAPIELDANRQVLRSMSQDTEMVLHDVSTGTIENTYIASIRHEAEMLVPGRSIEFEVEVQGVIASESVDSRLSMLVDGIQIDDRPINVLPSVGAIELFRHSFQEPGDHVVEFRLSQDQLPRDDARWQVVPIRSRLRVLAVGGRPQDTRSLALALDPDPNSRSRIDVVEVAEQSWRAQDLANFDCVFLVNVGRIRRENAEALRRFVRNGGGLVIALGDLVNPASYEEQLGGVDGILPVALREIVPTGDYQIDPLDYDHSIVAPFRGFPGAGLLSAPIFRYRRFELIDDSGANVILQMQNGDPLLVERLVGSGSCMVFASTMSSESLQWVGSSDEIWSAFADWPCFVPLVQEIVRYCQFSHVDQKNHIVNDSIEGTARTIDTPPRMMIPGGRVAETHASTDRQRLEPSLPDGAADQGWFYGETDRAGIYRVIGSETERPIATHAVNLATEESRLSRWDPVSLPAQIDLVERIDDDPQRRIRSSPAPRPFQWLLLAMLVGLLIECVLAWRFGRPMGASR